MFSRLAVYLAGTLAFLAYPVVAFAQSALTTRIVPCDGVNCTVCDIATLGQNILNTGIYIAVFFSAVLFAWAGFRAVTSGGNAEQFKSARDIFTNVVIGLIIILVGWLVVDTLMRTMTGASFGPWNKICEVFLTYFEHYYA